MALRRDALPTNNFEVWVTQPPEEEAVLGFSRQETGRFPEEAELRQLADRLLPTP